MPCARAAAATGLGFPPAVVFPSVNITITLALEEGVPRSDVAIEKALKKYPTAKIYFSSPNISNPEIFLKLFRKTEQNSFKTEETTVAQNLFFADLDTGELSYYYNNEFTQMPINIPQDVRNVNYFLKFYGKDTTFCLQRSE